MNLSIAASAVAAATVAPTHSGARRLPEEWLFCLEMRSFVNSFVAELNRISSQLFVGFFVFRFEASLSYYLAMRAYGKNVHQSLSNLVNFNTLSVSERS